MRETATVENEARTEGEAEQQTKERFGRLWRHRDFMRLWSAQIVSVFGTRISGAALSFTAIIALHATPTQLSFLRIADLLPGCLAGLVAGVWVDRLRRRPIMICADLARALLLATIPLAAILHRLRVEQLYLIVFLTGLFTLLFDVADRSFLPTLVQNEELVEANSKLTASASVAEFGAFGIAGWLVQWLTGPMAILVDALSFLWSAVFLSQIRTLEPPPAPPEDREPLLTELREGLATVWHNRTLFALIVTVSLVSLTGGMISVAYVAYMVRGIRFGPGLLGMIWAIGGATSLFGAAWAGPMAKRLGTWRAMVTGLLMSGVGTMLTPLAHGPTLVSGVLLVANQLITDPLYTIYDINATSLRQSLVPDRLQGRVNATFETVGLGATLIGAVLGGWLGERIGLRGASALGAMGYVAAGLWLAWALRGQPQ